jgi:hypothetical protein
MTAHDAAGISRRRFMNASAAGLGAASISGLAACAGPAHGGQISAGRDFNDTVFEAFKTHRLVGIGETETFGSLQNHYDVLAMLLADPRLPEVVDDIVVEFGNALYQGTIDRFIAGQPVNDADLRLVWRNTTASPLETWDGPVYEQLYRTVRAVNWARPPGRQIRVLLGDPPIDWYKITKASEIDVFGLQRDAYPASLVERQVLDKGHRALICYGWWHLLHSFPHRLVDIIEQRTGERTYVIADLVPLAGDPGGLARRLSQYSRNTVIPTASTWLGSFDAGLMPPSIQGGGPISKETNPWCDVPLGSLIDAGLYEGQPEDLTASWPNPAIYLDPEYWTELQRRNALQGHFVKLDSYRQEQPTQYPPLKLPPSQECGKTP